MRTSQLDRLQSPANTAYGIVSAAAAELSCCRCETQSAGSRVVFCVVLHAAAAAAAHCRVCVRQTYRNIAYTMCVVVIHVTTGVRRV
jgi:hypothetical protein